MLLENHLSYFLTTGFLFQYKTADRFARVRQTAVSQQHTDKTDRNRQTDNTQSKRQKQPATDRPLQQTDTHDVKRGGSAEEKG